MTKTNLVTAPVGTNFEKAKDLLQKYKIEKISNKNSYILNLENNLKTPLEI